MFHKEKSPVNGASEEFGCSGFYFQQRRAKLDLRSISKLDLNEIINSVDVESLQEQLENITFGRLDEEDLRFATDEHIVKLFKASQLTIEYLLFAQEQLANSLHNLACRYADKKKTLEKKRDEIDKLRESVKHTQKELRVKKKGIKSLEDLIKDGYALNPAAFAAIDQPIKSSVTRKKSSIVKYYIASVKGFCLEIQSPVNTTIAEVIADIRGIFISRGLYADTTDAACRSLKLQLRGVDLSPDSTLEVCEIKVGDTLEASCPSAVSIVEEKKPEKVFKKQIKKENDDLRSSDGSYKRDESNESDGEQKYVKKERVFVTNRRENKPKEAVEVLETNLPQQKIPESPIKPNMPSNDLLLELFSKQQETMKVLAEEIGFERALRRKEQDEHLKVRKLISAGDIESDDGDDEGNTRVSISKKRMVLLEKKIEATENVMSNVQNTILRQSTDMSEIKQLLLNKENAVKPEGVVLGIIPDLLKPESPRSPQSNTTRVFVNKKKTILTEEKIVEPTPVSQGATTLVNVKFRVAENRDLVKFSNLLAEDAVVIPVEADLEFDDLIFEIRNFVAEKLDLSLSLIGLQLGDGTVITLGIDSNTKFTSVEAEKFASEGKLKVRILSSPLSDADLDALVDQMQQQQIDQMIKQKLPVSKYYEKSKTKNPTDRVIELLSDNSGPESCVESENAAEKLKILAKAQESLSAMLSDTGSLRDSLNDSEGLTDEELTMSRSKLAQLSSSLPTDISQDFEEYSKDIVASVLNAAHEDPDSLSSTAFSFSATSPFITEEFTLTSQQLQKPTSIEDSVAFHNVTSGSNVKTSVSSRYSSEFEEELEDTTGFPQNDTMRTDDESLALSMTRDSLNISVPQSLHFSADVTRSLTDEIADEKPGNESVGVSDSQMSSVDDRAFMGIAKGSGSKDDDLYSSMDSKSEIDLSREFKGYNSSFDSSAVSELEAKQSDAKEGSRVPNQRNILDETNTSTIASNVYSDSAGTRDSTESFSMNDTFNNSGASQIVSNLRDSTDLASTAALLLAGIDLNRTVDTDISMPTKNADTERYSYDSGDILRAADSFERDAAHNKGDDGEMRSRDIISSVDSVSPEPAKNTVKTRTPSQDTQSATPGVPFTPTTGYSPFNQLATGARTRNSDVLTPYTENLENSGNFDDNPLHGGDSLQFSESGNSFGDVLDDSVASAVMSLLPNNAGIKSPEISPQRNVSVASAGKGRLILKKS